VCSFLVKVRQSYKLRWNFLERRLPEDPVSKEVGVVSLAIQSSCRENPGVACRRRNAQPIEKRRCPIQHASSSLSSEACTLVSHSGRLVVKTDSNPQPLLKPCLEGLVLGLLGTWRDSPACDKRVSGEPRNPSPRRSPGRRGVSVAVRRNHAHRSGSRCASRPRALPVLSHVLLLGRLGGERESGAPEVVLVQGGPALVVEGLGLLDCWACCAVGWDEPSMARGSGLVDCGSRGLNLVGGARASPCLVDVCPSVGRGRGHGVVGLH